MSDPAQLRHYYVVAPPRRESGGFASQLGVDTDKMCEEFMRLDLEKSGLTPEDVNAKPRYDLQTGEAAAYYLPYYGLTGNVITTRQSGVYMYRIRRMLNESAPENAGKYTQPARRQIGDLAVSPYLPPALFDLHGDTLLICEGEKKTAAACKYLGIPAIGIGGCHNWKAPDNRLHDRIHPWITEMLQVKGITNVIVVPDGDIRRYDISRAYGTFVTLLRETGYEANIVQLPNTEDKLDDLLVKWRDQHGVDYAKEQFHALPRIRLSFARLFMM